MTIGEVLAKLRPEFSDITISKIRFLESEGLVEPDRTPSGYRKFTHTDLERLQYILAAQRDHYLPLRVIKDQLDALDNGQPVTSAPQGPQPPVTAGLPGAKQFGDEAGAQTRLSRDELLTASGLTEEHLDVLEQHGLVLPMPGTVRYDADALLIARTVTELSSYGIEPRHLRGFRAAVDREVGLVGQVLTPLRGQREADGGDTADETGRAIAALFVRLHATLVKSRLDRL
ncbi:MAG: MerR family DNA-binding transcriptional regulator [Streptosporangiales bacterium]|nr:MerR family DNA-binding transcriptional regulator [Streptosporangiales bacterium]